VRRIFLMSTGAELTAPHEVSMDRRRVRSPTFFQQSWNAERSRSKNVQPAP